MMIWNIDLLESPAFAGLESPASKGEFSMADKIAMRSLVISKNLPRIGGLNIITNLKNYLKNNVNLFLGTH